MESTLGKRIQENRKRLGLTQEQLAEKLSVTGQAVSKWESDISCPDITTLAPLADIFGMSVDELLRGRKKETGGMVLASECGKKVEDMFMKILVDAKSDDGDNAVVKVSIPVPVIKVLVSGGMNVGQMVSMQSGGFDMSGVDFDTIIQMLDAGVCGELVNVECSDKDGNEKVTVHIIVE